MGVEDGGVVSPRFYLDESLPEPVRRALALVRDDVTFPGYAVCPVHRGAKDEVWLPIIGRYDWIVILRDRRIRYRAREQEALLDAGVRSFVLNRAGNYTRWETLDLLVRRWSEIEEKAETEMGPYIYSVTKAGLRKLFPKS